MAVTEKRLGGALSYHANGNKGMPAFGCHLESQDAPVSENKLLAQDLIVVNCPNLSTTDITTTGQHLWINNTGRSMVVVGISAVWGTKAGQAGTIMVDACASGTAPGAGTDLIASAIDATGDADTVVAATLHATAANLVVANGASICASVGSGSLASLVDACISIALIPKTLVTVSDS